MAEKEKTKGIYLDERIMQLKIPLESKVILSYVIFMSNGDNECFASNQYFATKCSKSVSTINRRIQKLIDKGYISSTTEHTQKGVKRILAPKISITEIVEIVKSEKRNRVESKNDKKISKPWEVEFPHKHF